MDMDEILDLLPSSLFDCDQFLFASDVAHAKDGVRFGKKSGSNEEEDMFDDEVRKRFEGDDGNSGQERETSSQAVGAGVGTSEIVREEGVVSREGERKALRKVLEKTPEFDREKKIWREPSEEATGSLSANAAFDAFDLDDFMADFVPPEEEEEEEEEEELIGVRLGAQIKTNDDDDDEDTNNRSMNKESEQQKRERLKRNREAAQLSRARKKKKLEDLANAARSFRAQAHQANDLCAKLANENHVLRIHLAHLARFATQECAIEAKKINLPPLPPPVLTKNAQLLPNTLQTLPPVIPSQTGNGQKLLIPAFNPLTYAPAVTATSSKRIALKDDDSSNNNNNNNGQHSNTNSPKRQRTKKSSVVATATAIALSTACVMNNTNKAAQVVSRSGTAVSLATNVGRLATRHLTAFPGSFADERDQGFIASPDLKEALEQTWTMPEHEENEKLKHSKALAFASEAIKKLSFFDDDEEQQKEEKETKINTAALNVWSSSEIEKDTTTEEKLLSDEGANKIDPWFAAFRSSRMHDVIQKMSRVDCAEVFQYKISEDEDMDDDGKRSNTSAAANIITSEYETEEQRIARKRSSGAIPLDDGTGYPQPNQSSSQHRQTVFNTADGDETMSSSSNNQQSSIVSMLLPPWEMTNAANDKSAAAMLRRLTKTFIVMFSKQTGVYTTYACKLPIAGL